ncbi:MAG: flagellar filament capping protein FliD [Pseudomonadota bacterium]
MAITASTNTAFDVATLVSQLMAVERRPIDRLNTLISDTQAKISSLGTLSGLVSTFQGASLTLKTSLEKLTAAASDATALSATALASAVPGAYAVNVTRLAQSQSLVAAGQTSTTAAIGNGSASTLSFDFGTISGGTLTNGVYSGASFSANGSGPQSVTIDGTNNTLEGIRDAINAAGMGVSATIVNDGSGTPYRLALTSTSSGVTNSMRISVSGGDGALASLLGYDPAGTQNLTQTQSAQNASLTVNGIAITSASNTVKDAIQGVTLTLKNTTATPASLTVARDTAAMTSAASGFVDAYNALASQLKSRSSYGADGKTGGVLAGDSGLRLMQEQLRTIFLTPATGGTLSSLAQIGIAFQREGVLQLDSSKFNDAIANDFADVTNLLASASGFATRLEEWGRATLSAGGLIDSRTQSLNDYVKDRNAEVDRLELRMTALEKKYTAEYTNLNLLLGRMNTTSTFLTQQLATSQKND